MKMTKELADIYYKSGYSTAINHEHEAYAGKTWLKFKYPPFPETRYFCQEWLEEALQREKDPDQLNLKVETE